MYNNKIKYSVILNHSFSSIIMAVSLLIGTINVNGLHDDNKRKTTYEFINNKKLDIAPPTRSKMGVRTNLKITAFLFLSLSNNVI